MWAEFDVEVGGDAPTLTVPYPGYVDVAENPELISEIPEARDAAMREAILALNAGTLRTAKCDIWATTELDDEEASLGCTHKHACYVDVYFRDVEARAEFESCERAMTRWTQELRAVGGQEVGVSFVLRACEVEGQAGYYWTVYVSGYGDTGLAAREAWAGALRAVSRLLGEAAAQSESEAADASRCD